MRADGVYVAHEKAKPYKAMIRVNGQSIPMEVDTGSAFTICDAKCWKSIGCPRLRKTNVSVRSFTGHEVRLKGEAKVKLSAAWELNMSH